MASLRSVRAVSSAARHSARWSSRPSVLALALLAAVAGFAGSYSGPASALSFTPSEADWLKWPEWCRARYVTSGAGANSLFVRRVDPRAISYWQRQLGESWYGLHHYCAALVYMDQARLRSGKAADSKYRGAINETLYTLGRTPDTHPMAARMMLTLAEAYNQIGEGTEASFQLSRALELFPRNAMVYTTAGAMLRRSGKLAQAREILEQGNEAVQGKSAELHYVLGLVCLDLNDIPAAQEHAALAYQKGYPLPALKRKLKARGAWTASAARAPDPASAPDP